MEFRTLANLNRFREIVSVLVKYGFDDLIHRFNLPVPKADLRESSRAPRMTTEERMRLALQELGPTFIKFGQLLSLRPDVLHRELIAELTKLQDQVAPEPFDRIRQVVESSLQRPLSEVFILFEETPLAAASISQVHRATLRDTGEVVAVKIQRPDIAAQIETDLNILEATARQLHQYNDDLQVYDLPQLVALTRRTIHRELDFRREARYMQIARAHLKEMTFAHVPTPDIARTTRHVLIMEFVKGRKLNELHPGDLEDPCRLGRNGLRLTLAQILDHGFFHADPHPGNLLITDDERLCLLDWGMVGRLSRTDRDELLELVLAVVEGNSTRLVEAILTMTTSQEQVNRRNLERDLMDIVDTHVSIPLNEVVIGQVLLDLGALLRDYRLRMPPGIFLMIKALIAAEQVGRTLCPDLNAIDEGAPMIRRLAGRRFAPIEVFRRMRNMVGSLIVANRRLPAQIGEIIHKLHRGNLAIRFEHHNLDPIRESLEEASDRLTLGIIIGAMVIGSSMIITTGLPPFLFGYPAIGIVGYMLSGVMGLWLVLHIVRSRRR